MSDVSSPAPATRESKLAYKIDEICELTGLSRATVYRRIAEGKLAARSTGRRTLILREDLFEFLSGLSPSATRLLKTADLGDAPPVTQKAAVDQLKRDLWTNPPGISRRPKGL